MHQCEGTLVQYFVSVQQLCITSSRCVVNSVCAGKPWQTITRLTLKEQFHPFIPFDGVMFDPLLLFVDVETRSFFSHYFLIFFFYCEGISSFTIHNKSCYVLLRNIFQICHSGKSFTMNVSSFVCFSLIFIIFFWYFWAFLDMSSVQNWLCPQMWIKV